MIGTFSRSIPTMPLVTPQDAHFDGRKFSWIGSMSSDTSLCLTGAKSKVKTFHDMLTMPVVMGGQFAAANSDIYAHLYKNIFGAKIKLVSGYPGTNDITLAMERGEVDGICGLSWGTLKVAHPDWMKNKSVNLLVQAALKKDPELPDVPLALDLIDDPQKKQILYITFAPQAIGRPFAAPPGIPADRKAALIKAFDDTMKDPALLAEAAKEKMDIAPMTGGEVGELVGQALRDSAGCDRESVQGHCRIAARDVFATADAETFSGNRTMPKKTALGAAIAAQHRLCLRHESRAIACASPRRPSSISSASTARICASGSIRREPRPISARFSSRPATS